MSDKILCPISKLIKNLEINAAKKQSESIAEVKKPITTRCHCCKRELDIDKFYSSRGIIDTYRCKSCHRNDYMKMIREHPLF